MIESVRHFVPGTWPEDAAVLSRMRWAIPRQVAATYVEAYSRPGDIVLLPYCQGSGAVRAILEAGRRALAFNFDPLLVLIIQDSLQPLPDRELRAAVALLGDSLKQKLPLRDFLQSLYATSCPACFRPAVATYYIWDREEGAPVAKHVHCGECDWDGRAATDDEDRGRLGSVPSRGMHYHFVLDRVAPAGPGDALGSRLESLLRLYSPRNLYALAELTLKIERHFPKDPEHSALKVALLDCLERCSSLVPPSGSLARRRGLSRPGRYLEYNVWQAFEEAVAGLRLRPFLPVPGLVDSLGSFLGTDTPQRGFVGQGSVRDICRRIPSRTIRLILASPPPLDASVWSLSYLWSAWLLGAEASATLRPLLRQRTPEPNWYARVMAASLRYLGQLLQDAGRLVLVLSEQRTAVVEALLLAAGGAGLGVSSLVQRGSDYRIELTPAMQLPLHVIAPSAGSVQDTRGQLVSPGEVSSAQTSLETAIRDVSAEAALEAIRSRGEPVAWRTLHCAIQKRLSEVGLLAQAMELSSQELSPLELVDSQIRAALEDQDLVRLPGPEPGELLWWLDRPAGAAPALSDRVENASSEVLQAVLALPEAAFDAAVLERFPGILTPEARLVRICLRAYGREASPDFWQLRDEDSPYSRHAERRAMVGHLRVLGQRLGYRSSTIEPFDLGWSKGGQVVAAFVVRWQALLGEVLPMSRHAPGVQPYLLIPGGRSALVSYKLAHNPVWKEEVERNRWLFIKYRHLRHLLSRDDVDEFVLSTIIGLDPLVEQESAQLSLF